MPVENIRQDPASLLLGASFLEVRRHLGGEARSDLGDPSLPFAHRLGGFRRPGSRPRQADAIRDQPGPDALEPVAQLERRDAVVAVVAGDDALHVTGDAGDIVELQASLDDSERAPRIRERHRPLVAVEASRFLIV